MLTKQSCKLSLLSTDERSSKKALRHTQESKTEDLDRFL